VAELITLVIYDVEDDRARTHVAEACKDFGLVRIQYSCFRGKLSQNKREELYERMRKVQREWETRWRKDFPESRVEQIDYPDPPDSAPAGRWEPAFKILIQPLCEKDIGSATYAYVFVDVPKSNDQHKSSVRSKSNGSPHRNEAEKPDITPPPAEGDASTT
jgi:CRISPR/Cas system-associated endoribonuclease Cas2